MLYSLAIVLALAMVLCMVPVSFAAGNNISYGSTQYDLYFFDYQKADITSDHWADLSLLADKSGVNTLTVEYNYETLKDDTTGQFDEDVKMGILEIKGWNPQFNGQQNVEVTVDGSDLEVNAFADYYVGDKVGWQPDTNSVYIPVRFTKAGFQDTYLIEISYTDDDDNTYTQTAKISLVMKNTAAYKNAKTAYIQKIESQDRDLDAYIVGNKIYLDFVDDNIYEWDKNAGPDTVFGESVKITFADNNHDAFGVTTWAYIATDVDDSTQKYFVPAKLSTFENYQGVEVSGSKLSDSAMEYKLWDITEEPTVAFKLETKTAIFETKDYDVVVRAGVEEADPKGIYFAETEKTIAIGESYTPVVMGVATNKKVDATILPGDRTAIQVIDVTDGETVIGTQEGVAYITAEYAPATLVNKDDAKEINYTANSMKIIVTAKGATDDDDTTDGKTYMVTASSLRVRSGAGTNFSQIGSLKNGATVKVESIANGWAKLENGGYVSAQYLAEVVDNGEAQTMYVTARTLNVRKGPGTSYAKVGTLSRGTAVQVVGFSGNWAKLSNGYYVSTSYLAK